MKSFLFSTILLIILLIGFAWVGRRNSSQEDTTDPLAPANSSETGQSETSDPSQGELYSAGRKIVSLVAAIPGIRIKQSEGMVHDYLHKRQGSGKKIAITGSISSFSNGTYPDRFLRDTLTGLGWKEDFSYAADGPDGTSFAFRSGPVLCLFNASWDGGDRSDSTKKTDDGYALTIHYALTSNLEPTY